MSLDLINAAKKGDLKKIESLISQKVNLEFKDSQDWTALHHAAFNSHSEVLELLLKARADMDAKINSGHTPLHLAALNGHSEVLELLLKAGADMAARDNRELTPLHLAALNGHREVLELLLKAGADMDAGTNDGHTPLHLAALNGHREVLELLLKAGADMDARTNTDFTPLHIAAQEGHSEVLELLLKAGADMAAKINSGHTPLHLAAHNGHSEVLELLLKARADMDARTNTDFTPLHIAAQEGHSEVLELLLKAGADMDAGTNDGHTPLHIAAHNGRSEVLELLLKAGADMAAKINSGHTPLHIAAQESHSEVLELLLKAGADMAARDNRELTPLHIAAHNGRSEVLERLLKAGADMDAKINSGHTPLHLAALNGHSEVLELLLKAGADMDARDNRELTPLHIAAALNGHSEVLELLLKAGADMAAGTNDGHTPLHIAAHNGRSEVLERLLKAGADMAARDNREWTPLHIAAHNGHREVLELLLKAGADMAARDNRELTPLHIAALNGHREVLELLLKAGADMDAGTNDGTTPLHIAAHNGHSEVLERLLKAGADMAARDNREWTPLHLAAHNGRSEVLELLLKAGADMAARDNREWTPLHLAALNGHSEVLERLLKAGADMAARDNREWTPLHLAAQDGHSEVLELLLKAGADMDAKINSGNTPLHIAAHKGHREVLERLLKAGADMAARDNREWTPLHIAAHNGRREVLELLLKAGADMAARDNRELTPLHLAALNGHREVLELLLKAGADMAARDNRELTPLHLAALNGHREVLELLLKAGADMDAGTNDGTTPLHLAAQDGHSEVLELLLKAGADMAARDNRELTPLHLAAQKGHSEVLELLLKAGADMAARDNRELTPLHLAAQKGHSEVLELLLKAGADMDALSNLNETPLYMAVNADKVNIVKILLNAGVDRELQYQKHGSPLHCATAGSNAKMVNLLLDNGANIEAVRVFDEMSPLSLAASNGYKQIVELLLDRGAIIDAMDQSGRTALYFTLNEGWDDISELLLARGAKIDDLDGRVLIHVAAAMGDIRVIKKLLAYIASRAMDEEQVEAKAELSSIDSDGNTALHIAAAKGHKNIVKFLLKQGIDTSITNGSGLTVFELANEIITTIETEAEAETKVETTTAITTISDASSQDISRPDVNIMQDIMLLFRLILEVKDKYIENPEMQSLYLRIIYDENINVSSIEELESKYLKIFKLKETYRADDKLPKLIDDEAIKEQSLEDYYVKLQIILRDSAKQQGVAGRTELASGEKKPIEMVDIFSRLDSEHPESSKLLMLGSAGVGKSTLMHYISYRWGRGDLWNDKYDFVFRVKLKNLLQGGDWKSIEDGENSREDLLVKFIRLCLPETIRAEFDKETITQVLKEHNDKILFLLDGYDEVANLVVQSGTRAQLMFDQVMSCQNVILTSRPNAIRDDLKNKFERVVENIGLDDYGIEQYIDNAFAVDSASDAKTDFGAATTVGRISTAAGGFGRNSVHSIHRKSIVATDTDLVVRKELVSELKDFLEHNSMIRGICTVPINTALVCLIWQSSKDKFGENFTISTLYQEVVTWLGKRHLKKFDKDYAGRDLEEINDENVVTSAEVRAFKEVAHKGFTESQSLILSGRDIDRYIDVVRQTGAAKIDIYHLYKYGLLKTEQESKNLLNNMFGFIHLTFQEYLLALKFGEMLQENAMVPVDDIGGTSISMAESKEEDDVEQQNQTIGEFLAHHRDEPRYLMSLKFLAALVEKARFEANQSRVKQKDVEQAQLLVTGFWEAMSCNIDGVVDLDVKEKVKLLLHLLGQVKDLSGLEQAAQDQDVRLAKVNKVKIPNLKEMIEFVDSELLRDIDYWGQEIIASEYRSTSIVRFFDSEPNITTGDSADLDSFASKIDFIASSRYSADKLEEIISNLIAQFEQTGESASKKLILESLVKLANKDLSHELKELILAKYLDILKAVASKTGLSEAGQLEDIVKQDIGELAVKLQLGDLLLTRLTDLVTATNSSSSRTDATSETQVKDKKYIIKIITEIAKDQSKLTNSAYKHLAEMIKSDDLSIRSDLAASIADLVSVNSNLAEQGFKTLLISLKHSQDDDIDNLSAAICSILQINPQIILSELANIVSMLDAEEFQTKQVGISLLAKYVEIDNAIIPSIYPKLQNLLTDSNWQIKKAAVEALGQFAEHSSDIAIVRDIYQSLLPMLEDTNNDIKSATIKSLGNCVAGDSSLAAEVQEKIMPLFTQHQIAVMKSLEQCMKFDHALEDVVYGKVITELSYAYTDMNQWQVIFSVLETCAKVKPELKSELYSRLQSGLDREQDENIHMDSVLAECLKSDEIDVKSILNKLHSSDNKAAVVKTVMVLLDKINAESASSQASHSGETATSKPSANPNASSNLEVKTSQEKILNLYKIFDYKRTILEFAKESGNGDAKKLFGKLSTILKDHMPDVKDEALFIEFISSIDQKFDSLYNEETKALFKVIYTKLLEFESQDSSSLQDISRNLLVKFLQAGFTTSFDLNKCELIYEGRHYKIINDRSILEEEFCESAVTAANEAGNPLARQFVDHQPLFVNSSEGNKVSSIKKAASDVQHSVGVLSGDELYYSSYDVSLCARSNHNGDLQDSFILLEQRLVTGEYLYRKVYAENGQVKVTSKAMNPIDMEGGSGTEIRKAIFGEMSYYGSDISGSADAEKDAVERPVYCTKTVRIGNEDAVVSMYRALNGSESIIEDDVDGIFALFSGKVEALLTTADTREAAEEKEEEKEVYSKKIDGDVGVSWEAFRAESSTEHNKVEMLKLEGAELIGFNKDEAYFKDHVKLGSLDREFREAIQKDAEILQQVIDTHKMRRQEKKEIEEIQADSYKNAFYKALRMELNSAYLAAKSIDSGWIKSNKQGDIGKFGSFMKEVSGVVPIVGPGVNMLGAILTMADAKKQSGMIKKFAEFVVDSSEMSEFAEKLARSVVLNKDLNIAAQSEDSLVAKLKGYFVGKVAGILSGAAENAAIEGVTSAIPKTIPGSIDDVGNSLFNIGNAMLSALPNMLQQKSEEAIDEGYEEAKSGLMEAASDKLAGVKADKDAVAVGKAAGSKIAKLIIARISVGEFESENIEDKIDEVVEFVTDKFAEKDVAQDEFETDRMQAAFESEAKKQNVEDITIHSNVPPPPSTPFVATNKSTGTKTVFAGGCSCVVSHEETLYGNVILQDHSNWISFVAKNQGVEASSKLIDLGTEFDVVEAIFSEIQTHGADQVFGILFGDHSLDSTLEGSDLAEGAGRDVTEKLLGSVVGAADGLFAS